MKILQLFLLAILLLSFTGCKSIRRMTNHGGSTFTAQIETNEANKDEIYKEVLKVLERRADAVGIDAEFLPDANQPGHFTATVHHKNEDIERLKKFLFSTYRLELKKAISPGFPEPVRTFSTREEAEKLTPEIHIVLPYKARGDEPPKFVIVEKNSIITGKDIRSAQAYSASGNDSDYQINFTLREDGGKKLGEWSQKNIANYLAVVLNDEIQSIPYIQSPIYDSGQITGRFSKTEAEDIALSLNSGYLPATIKLLSEKPFGEK